MPVRSGRVGRKHSHRKCDRSAPRARCGTADKQVAGRRGGAKLAHRIQLSVGNQSVRPIGFVDHMHRFYISPKNWDRRALALTNAEAHHARDVLRLKSGEKLVVFNGRGREITAEIVDPVRHGTDSPGRAKDEIRLRKLHEAETPSLRCRITLGQAIPKGKNMDLIVQKAVEIGAAEIAPILSDRTVVRLDEESAASKQSKWQTVAIEAAKQCGQNWLPRVQVPQTMAQFFQQPRRFDLQLIGSLQSDAAHLKKILSEY